MADVKPATDERFLIYAGSENGGAMARRIKARLDAEKARADAAEAELESLADEFAQECDSRQAAEKLAKSATRSAEIEKGLRGEMQAAMDAAEKRVVELKATREWQPIEEYPPPEDERVCLSDGQYIVHGDIFTGKWRDDVGRALRPQPTHWQSLPDPPTSEPEEPKSSLPIHPGKNPNLPEGYSTGMDC
jgi:hypothetical protein